MTSRFYRLPSLNALATFEASARHRSFKRAASELNVTPGAVSRQIKSLEEELGFLLFERSQSGLMLTSEGGTLFSVLFGTFSRMSEVLDALRPDQRCRHVTLACTHAFAKFWLMPRMNEFWKRYPDICVNHLISDDSRDVRGAEIDLRIRYGFGGWPGEKAVFLFPDTIYPVATPGFAERHGDAAEADLPKLPLLHVDWVDSDWTGWDEFLRRTDIAHAGLSGPRFSNFEIALEACRQGQGVAIGWDRLTRDMIAAGELVRFTELRIPAPGSYYLTWNTDLVAIDAVRTVRDWLLGTAERYQMDQQRVAG